MSVVLHELNLKIFVKIIVREGCFLITYVDEHAKFRPQIRKKHCFLRIKSGSPNFATLNLR